MLEVERSWNQLLRKGGSNGGLNSFRILSILALEFGEWGARDEGKTGEFKEFICMVQVFLEEQSG